MLFLHSIMIAARAFGLETRSQAAGLIVHDVLQRRLGIPAGVTIVCGMSLGYPDPADTVNTFTPDRMETGEFATWVDTLQE